MNEPWFDERTGVLLFDEHVAESPSFQKVAAGGTVTDEELHEQSHKVVSLLKELEAKLSPPLKSLVTRMLTELAVLHAIHACHVRQGMPSVLAPATTEPTKEKPPHVDP